MQRLIVIAGPCKGAIYPLASPTTRLGRGTDNAIELPVTEVSRHHAELILEGAIVKVRDLNSSNGTFVNDCRITESLLNPGDHLKLGGVDLLYDVSETAPAGGLAAELLTSQDQLTALREQAAVLTAKLQDAEQRGRAELNRVNAELAQAKQQLAGAVKASEEHAALRQQHAELTARLQSAEQRFIETETRSRAELDRVSAALTAVRAELEPAKQAAHRVALLTEQTATQVRQLAAARQQAEVAAASATQMKAEWAQQAGLLQADLAHAKDTITGLQDELDRSREVADEVAPLRKQKDDLAAELFASQNQLAELREQITGFTAKLKGAEQRGRAELNRVNAELAQAKERLAEAAKIHKEFTALRCDADDLAARLRSSESHAAHETGKLKRSNTELSEKYEKVLAALQQARTDLKHATQTAAAARTELKQVTQAKANLERLVADDAAELASTKKSLHETRLIASREAAETCRSAAALQEANAHAAKAMAELTARNETLTKQLAAGKRQAAARQQRTQLTERLSQLSLQFDETRTALQETQTDLQQAKQIAAAQAEGLNRQNRELLAELAETRAQLEIADAASLRVAEMTEHNRQLETELAAAQKTFAAADQAARDRAAAEAQRAHGELARVRAELDILGQRVAQAEASAVQNEQLAAQLREAQTAVVVAQQIAAVEVKARRDGATQLAQARAELLRRDNELAELRVATVAVPVASGIRPTERRRRSLCGPGLNRNMVANPGDEPSAREAGKISLRPAGVSLEELISGSSEAFEFALGLDSSHPEAFYGRALTLRRLGQYEKAQLVLDEALALHARDARLLKEQAMLHCARRRYDRALTTLDQVLLAEPEDVLALEWKVATLCAQRRFKEADKTVRQALTRFPNSAGLLAECGYLCYDQGRYDEASEFFDRALGLNAKDEVALQWKIASLRRLGCFTEAGHLLEQAISRFPRNAGLRIERGLLHYDQHQYDDAVAAFDEALARDRGNEEALQWKITALRLQQRFREAARLIEEILSQSPQSAAILSERGYLHFDRQEYDRAIESLDQALALDASNEDALQWKVAALRLECRFHEAEQALQGALALFPNSDALRNEHRLLVSIRV